MTSPNTTLSTSRYLNYLKKRSSEDGRWLMGFSAFILAFMLVMSIGTAVSFTPEAADILQHLPYNPDFNAMAQFNHSIIEWNNMQHAWILAVATGAILLSASRMFANLSTKEGRLKEILTPATSVEKFIASFTIYIIGTWILVLIAHQITLYATWGLMSAFTSYGTFYHPYTTALFSFPGSLDWNDYFWDENMTVGLSFLYLIIFFQSFFTLGSAVWPKNAYMKTLLATFFIFGIMTFIALFTNTCIVDTWKPRPNLPEWVSASQTYVILIIALTITNYILALSRFREMDVNARW